MGGPPPGGGFGGGGFGGGPGFGPPGGFPPPGGPMMPGAGGDVNTTLPLILNIVAAVLCGAGCLTFILSIVGIVFAVQGGNAKNAGDIATAKAKAKTSMLMFIITAVLGTIGAIVTVILRVLNS
jgi:Interferon-induced transmembrane protein